MTNEQFLNTYLDSIFLVENNTTVPYQQAVLPENCVMLGFLLRHGVSEVIQGIPYKLPEFTIDGQLTCRKDYVVSPGSKIYLAKFKPHTASLFFANLHEFTNLTICIRDLIPRDLYGMLEDRFFHESDKKEVIINFLRHLVTSKPIDRSIIQAITIATETKGCIRVEELAQRVAHSKRNFERKFKNTTGLTPKQFITNIRFRHTLALLQSREPFVAIAHACGYYDQSHFNHEFKKITGTVPGKQLQ